MTQDPKTKHLLDEVTLVQWSRDKRNSEEVDYLERYITESKDSEIVAYRRAGFKSIEIYFDSMFEKLVLLSGNYIATIYDLVKNDS